MVLLMRVRIDLPVGSQARKVILHCSNALSFVGTQ
ncbi:hypothetical protein PHM2_011 [Prochlorococcus phage P-HM2]|uniref:Uncharacterized protein n=1 Tax=Prochlorococcus phage P-HM2 TaxID=445696 RepID=E3SSL1_9CAUD|nr:hypothetical protein PHM2_011 [Prochlorococcus phage P-HM2]ADO99789.1 hypothetical protein PHM2_011 [Prochlorococcus phage P-HM2]